MKIGIIGAGEIGGTLTRRLTALGHQVSVANSRGPESLAELAAETGAKAVPVEEAARFGEVVVVTIPEKNIPNLPRDLFASTPDTVVVVDTGNYYPRQRDGRIDGIEAGLTESRWVAQQLNRPMIKAFNNIYAEHLLKLGKPKGKPGRIALPVAGDDPAAPWMSPGVNSPLLRFTAKTSMQRVYDVHFPRRVKNEKQSGAEPQTVQEPLRIPPEAIRWTCRPRLRCAGR
jgi:predicted dinucleotide-binding enzyme